MELKAKLEQLHQRVDGIKEQITTEEATKNAFIMPFIQTLGYDVFNPTEVIPEFICDIGTKKGEKIDYLIMKDGEPIFIIECKHWKENADAHNSQLHRYFHNTKSRFGILTNGIVYNFYTDLEQPNIMDEKPFLTINLDDLKDSAIKVLEKFVKTSFQLDEILASAESLKYIKAIKAEFENEIEDPSDDLVVLLVKKFFNQKLTEQRKNTFKEYTKRAITSVINDIINSRLKSALNINEQIHAEKSTGDETINSIDENSEPQKTVITTEEEMEGFHIVKAILREILPADRIAFRDTQSYFGVLLDDNNRKPICRLHFNSSNKYIELFHNGKDAGEKIQILSLEDIYNYKNELQKTIENY